MRYYHKHEMKRNKREVFFPPLSRFIHALMITAGRFYVWNLKSDSNKSCLGSNYNCHMGVEKVNKDFGVDYNFRVICDNFHF